MFSWKFLCGGNFFFKKFFIRSFFLTTSTMTTLEELSMNSRNNFYLMKKVERVYLDTYMYDMEWMDERGVYYMSRRDYLYEMDPEFYFKYLAANPRQVRVFIEKNPMMLLNPVLAEFVLNLDPSLLPVFGRAIQSHPTHILRWAITKKADDAEKKLAARVLAGIRDRAAVQLTLRAVVEKIGLDPVTTRFLLEEARAYLLPSEVDQMFGRCNRTRAAGMTPAMWVPRLCALV